MNTFLKGILITGTILSSALAINTSYINSSYAQNVLGPQDTGAISLVSHPFNNRLGRHLRLGNHGDTLIGSIVDTKPDMTVEVTINSRTIQADVNPKTGNFLVRFDSEELQEPAVSITITPIINEQRGTTENFTLGTGVDRRGIVNILSRVTFGATPGLLEHFSNGRIVRKYRQYIQQQLSPETVDDSPFESLRTTSLSDELFNGEASNTEGVFRVTVDWRLQYSAYSERQLREVMTNFWDNHFYSYQLDSSLAEITELQGFRENAFGKFRELLRISSNSAVMMRYLNNNENRRGNINENYARELLELHTVGSNGGYTPEDIREVARVLTGWGWQFEDDNTSSFEYDENNHDEDDKTISFLELNIEGRSGEEGKQEREELLDALASNPSTHRFICSKLIQRFVADEIPDVFLNACVDTWARTDGDMREVLRTILLHPEYRNLVSLQRNKLKTPYEYMVSMLRNFAIYPAGFVDGNKGNNSIEFYDIIVNAMETAGNRFDQTPDGNSEEAVDWLSTGTMNANYSGFIELINPSKDSNGQFIENKYSDIDLGIFVENASVKTAEGIAAYLLELATSDRYKSDELDAVVQTLKGSDNIFNVEDNDDINNDIRRAITLVATLPSASIQ